MKKNDKKDELATLKDVSTVDFDTMFNMDTKELDKQVKFQQNRKGKKVQLLAKINQIQMRFAKIKTDYTKSMIDPTMDTVALAIEMETLVKEEQIAQRVYRQLFPNDKIVIEN